MLFYFLFIGVLILLIAKNAFKLAFFVASLVLAFRHYVGADYQYYYEINTSLGRSRYFAKAGFLDRFSTEFDFYNVLSNLALNVQLPRFPIILYGLCTMLCLYFVMAIQSFRGDRLLMYVSIPIFYLMSFSTISQHLSMALMLCAFILFTQNRHGISTLFSIAACAVHDIAILILPMFWVIKKIDGKYARRFAQGLLLFLIFFKVDIGQLIHLIPEFKYISYLLESKGTGGDKLLYLLIPLILVDLVHSSSRKYSTFLYMSILIWYILLPLGPVAYRSSAPFLLVYVIMGQGFFSFINKTVSRKFIYLSAVVSVFMFAIFLGKDFLVPYRFV